MPVTISFYDKFVEKWGQTPFDMDGDTWKVELHNNLTFTSTHTQRSDVSGSALATNYGYDNPGQNLVSVTFLESGGTTAFNAADVSWTAVNGAIGPATDAVIYNDTSVGDLLMCDIDFGGAETAGDGTDFKITWHVSGIFTIA